MAHPQFRAVPLACAVALAIAFTSMAGCQSADGGSTAGAAPTPKATPSTRTIDVSARDLEGARELIASGHYALARELLTTVSSQFPGTPADSTAKSELVRLGDVELAEEKEALAVVAKLSPAKSFTDDAGSSIHVNGVSVVRKWFYGEFGIGNRSYDADKDASYVVVSFDVTAKGKEPLLPCAFAFLRAPQGTTFESVVLSPEFRRWDSYGTMLGNYLDVGNSFAKSDTVQFASGGQVKLEDLSSKQLYVAFKKKPTLEHQEKGHDPPTYEGSCELGKAIRAKKVAEEFVVVEVRAPQKY